MEDGSSSSELNSADEKGTSIIDKINISDDFTKQKLHIKEYIPAHGSLAFENGISRFHLS